MATPEQQANAIKDAIRTIFNKDWDPLELMDDSEWPTNEYDYYINGMQQLLQDGESIESVAQHLYRIEEEYIGTATDMPELLKVAEKLKAINLSDQE